MTSETWNRLSPEEAKAYVKKLACSAQWEDAVGKSLPYFNSTTTHSSSNGMWMGMWMTFHKGKTLQGGV